MTPLHLDILRHYYVSNHDCANIPSIPVWTDYAFELASKGLLYSPRAEEKQQPLFSITDYGKTKMQKLLEMLDEN